eukprot:XP_028333781.1 multiple myeloma tumor-associated protein 2 homolog [Physeter catodon]
MAVYIRTSPPRDGVRGGREEFKWDSLKTNQDREYYLGASVKIGMHSRGGRFEKHDWWTKRRAGLSANELQEETQRVKDFENTLINEALGCTPKHLLAGEEYKEEQRSAVPAVDAQGSQGGQDRDLHRLRGNREAQKDKVLVKKEEKK